MVAGREMDAAIARLMGNVVYGVGSEHMSMSPTTGTVTLDVALRVPAYSTSIAAAMDALEKMNADGWGFGMVQVEGGWNVNAYSPDHEDHCGECGRRNTQPSATAETLPLALCEVLLAAIGTPEGGDE